MKKRDELHPLRAPPLSTHEYLTTNAGVYPAQEHTPHGIVIWFTIVEVVSQSDRAGSSARSAARLKTRRGPRPPPPAVEADANESGTLLTLRVNRPRRTEGETTGGYETDGEREGTEKVPSMAEKARRRMDGSERSTRTPAVKSYRCPGAAVRPEWVSRGSDQSDEVDGRWWWASDARGWTVFNNSQRGG